MSTLTACSITPERWQAAQDAERGYWYPIDQQTRAERRAEERARLRWVSGLLDISPESVGGVVIDIAGGPCPLVGEPSLPIARRVLVDPLALSPDDAAALGARGVERFAVPAEHFVLGAQADEVWAYNALQHVIDPVAVLNTAKAHADHVIRWFEWIDQPVTLVHPHAINVHFLPSHLDRWGKRTAWTVGIRDESRGWVQSFCAGVWQR